MSRIYLGSGLDRKIFERYFEPYVKKFLVKKNFLIPRIIWDYDIKNLKLINLNRYYCVFLNLDFMNIRSMENGNLKVKADIIFIKEFYKIPVKAQFKIVNNIKKGKFNSIIIFTDKKKNIDKYDSDLLDNIMHLNVKAQ